MVAGQGIAVARGDRRGDAGRDRERHAGGDIAMMVMAARMAGMLVGMMIAVVQRDIAEQHMLVTMGRARHVLDAVDHTGGTGAGEDKRQRDAEQRAESPQWQTIERLHGAKLARRIRVWQRRIGVLHRFTSHYFSHR